MSQADFPIELLIIANGANLPRLLIELLHSMGRLLYSQILDWPGIKTFTGLAHCDPPTVTKKKRFTTLTTVIPKRGLIIGIRKR